MNHELFEIAEKLIQQSGLLLPNALTDFREGRILCSEEPHGYMFDANAGMKTTVEMLEEDGRNKVWHIIKGTYLMSDGDRLQFETYLLASNDFPELEPWTGGGLLAHSYTKNLTWGERDYGDVVIKPNNGGLKRIS